MHSRLQKRRCGSTRDDRANRNSSTEPLGQSDDVRTHSTRLICKPVPGASDSCLHLIDDEERTDIVGEPTCVCEVIVARHDDSALSLDGFEEHRGSTGVHRFSERVSVSVRHDDHVTGKGPEWIDLARLGRQRQRPHRSSME